MAPGHPLRSIALGLIAILLAACNASPSAAPSSLAPSAAPVPASVPVVSSPSPSVAPLPTASVPPASATVTLGGGVKGLGQGIQVSCQSPSLDGLLIILTGATTTKDVFSTITLGPASIFVTIDSGSGTTFTGRSFSGLGVTDFDPTKGARIDSPLTAVTTSSNPGKLPALTSIKGSVDCGGQVPGSSTLTITGTAAEGPITGPIDPIRVDCNPNAKPASVHAVGLFKLVDRTAEVIFQATTNGFTAFILPTEITNQHFFTNTDPTTVSLSGTGAHVAGSATETGTTNRLQVSGDLVCGVINP
jgi:hypothetical protein